MPAADPTTDGRSATTAATAAKLAFFDALTTAPELTHLDTRVAWRLLHYHNTGQGHAWPSFETLAAEVHADKRSVRRATERLEKFGWFFVEHGRGRGHPNQYTPNLEKGTEQHPFRAAASG